MNCNCSRMIDQMDMEHFRAHMSDEEKIAAEESLKATYCPPVEFYIFFQRRAIKNVCVSLAVTFSQRGMCVIMSDTNIGFAFDIENSHSCVVCADFIWL